MATQDRAIEGEGAQTDGSYEGGAANYTNLNLDDDGATILNWLPQTTTYHCYNMVDFTESYDAIQGAQTTIKFASANTLYSVWVYPYVRINGVNYYGTWSGWWSQLTYTSYTYLWPTNPSTGLAWTANDINSAEFGIAHGTNNITIYVPGRTTYMILTITYTRVATRSSGFIIG